MQIRGGIGFGRTWRMGEEVLQVGIFLGVEGSFAASESEVRREGTRIDGKSTLA